MNSNQNKPCRLCGQNAALDTRYVACVAISTYDKTGEVVPVNISLPMYDDTSIWKISLCQSCLVEGSVNFLENRRKRDAKALKWGIFVTILGGVGGLLWDQFIGSTKNLSLMLLGGAFVMALVCGIPFTLFALFNYVSKSRSIKRVRESGIASTSHNDSFIGAAEKILRNLESGITSSLWADLHLPEFSKEILQPDKNPGWTLKRSRAILFAGNSAVEVTEHLSSQQKQKK